MKKSITDIVGYAKNFSNFNELLVSNNKTRISADAKRMVCTWLYEYTRYTYKDMGVELGFSTPSTAFYHIERHSLRMKESEGYRRDFADFKLHMNKLLR